MTEDETRQLKLRAIAEFHDRYSADRLNGDAFDLAHYQQRFPKFKKEIAAEYHAMEGSIDGEFFADLKTGVTTEIGKEGKVAHYRLLKVLGRGGQAVVWLAEDERIGRKVALKILRGFDGANQKTVSRFEREAALTSKLDHPSICPLLDVGVDDGLWIAMRYVPGQTLAEILRLAVKLREDPTTSATAKTASDSTPSKDKERPSNLTATTTFAIEKLASVLAMVEAIANALQCAHAIGVIHRDIKPHNVIITPDNEPVVLDFGIAYETEGNSPTLTLTGEFVGTPAYMAPEMISRNNQDIDQRVDVYALGVLLFECLTFRRPFVEPTRQGLFRAILNDEAPRLGEVDNTFSGSDLEVVVETALQKRPEHRYESAQIFAEELRRVIEHKPILARPISKLTRTRRWAQRNVALATSLSLIAILLIAGISSSGVLLARAKIALQKETEALDLQQSATTKTNIALAAETKERMEKEEALTDFERLADVKKCRQAKKTAAVLWPARPNKVEAIKAWLSKYKNLSISLADHRLSLANLRSSALPYTEGDRQIDHAKEFDEIEALNSGLTRAAADLKKATKESRRASIKKAIAKMKRIKASFESKIKKQITWNFAGDSVKKWQHKVLSELVIDLESFCLKQTGTYANVENRLAMAQDIKQKTITDHTRLWAQTTAAIKKSSKYDGFVLAPQLGLVPLGMDPHSGLFEFLHLETHGGDIPSRQENGRILMTGDTGIILVLIPQGSCWVGSQKTDRKGKNFDPQARPLEKLQRFTAESPFFLSKYEMTQGQWQRLPSAIKNPSRYLADRTYTSGEHSFTTSRLNPVENASWTLSTQSLAHVGLGLPSQWEWEYAARAKTSSIFAGNSNKIADIPKWGNIAGAEAEKTFPSLESSIRDKYALHAPVGQFLTNAFGLYDVLGNVEEWTTSKGRATRRVCRGGSYKSLAITARIARRMYDSEATSSAFVGMRPYRRVNKLKDNN